MLADMFLRGYFSGKRYAERVLGETFPEGGVALRPGFIHGTRNVRGVGIPLSAVGKRTSPSLPFPLPAKIMEGSFKNDTASRITIFMLFSIY
jgi:hypothetical protein